MGENHFAAAPTAVYGALLLMAAVAYGILQQTLIAAEGPGSALRRAFGSDWKGRLSHALHLGGIALTFWRPWAAQSVYALVALPWLIPDRRIEGAIRGGAREGG